MGIQNHCTEAGRTIRRWFEINRLRKELASFDHAMRVDLGLHAEADIAALSQNLWRRPGQMQRMLDRLNVSGHPSLANPGFRCDLERTCAACQAARACDRWLASGDREGYGAFYPNAIELSAMVAGQRAAHGG